LDRYDVANVIISLVAGDGDCSEFGEAEWYSLLSVLTLSGYGRLLEWVEALNVELPPSSYG
jgi:hypothetical protein